ncbi:sensor histidine kinase [Streptomyces sp. NRRL S-813]|uniref:sensor histidine kinase n=1 Tax=Streptomyces sp. NRRL S-813 TaxID=1463919 RepID=UPI0004C11B2C|nr:histidine kinase [Streptomyces sp. NRRL S-813]
MTTTEAQGTHRTGLLRRRPRIPEITTPPAGTVLPAHVRTGAPDIPVTSATPALPPALPPGWEPADGDAPPPLPPGRTAADGANVPQGPPAPDHESRTGGGASGNENPAEGGAEAETTARPPQGLAPEKIQISALQAMCRHVFAFRLAMIALSAPAALVHAAPGLATRLVGAAVVVTFMVSYVLFRDWERFGPLLLRHPTLLALDTLFGSLLLIAAGPDSTLAYVSVCTPLLAGLVYSWRGAAVFASLQSLILLVVYAASRELHTNLAQSALFPGLCLIAGAVGATQRTLLLRFGEATRALTTVQARLAVTEAVGAERARLAREMHDSVAKTLHGVAMAAEGLAGSAGDADRMDPALVRHQAELVARSARRAAAEARELLSDLRREHDPTHGTDVLVELAARTRDFSSRTGLPAAYRPTGAPGVPPIPPAVARQILTIASEAMENAHRHAAPTRVDVEAGVHGDLLRISVYDDGRGLPPGTTLEQLRRTGHFGLVGMVERAASVGARIRIGRGNHPKGTEVRLELPVAALTTPTAPTTPGT